LADAESHFPKSIGNSRTTRRSDVHRDWESMKAAVLIVTVTLALAILLAGWLLIAAGTRGRVSQAEPYSSSLRTQGPIRRVVSFEQ
jgi:ABC-type taurine transport system ATPase subunit